MVKEQMETNTIITSFIRDELLRGDSHTVPEPDVSLITTGILDSSAVLKLLLFIEDRFSITIEDSEVTPTNFESVERIVSFVQGKAQ
jgi:acyl carrier protein